MSHRSSNETVTGNPVPHLEIQFADPALRVSEAPAGNLPGGPVWDLLQGVLDEAFEAVHNARLRSQESAAALDDHKRQIAELEARCEQLQREHDNAFRDVAAQRNELDRLTAELAEYQSRMDGASPETLQRRVKLFYGCLNDITGVLASSERQMAEIRAHYAGAQIDQADMIEELNFARSETLAQITRVIHSLADRAKPAE